MQDYAFGNLLIALNTLAYAGYLVVSRPVVQRIPPLVAIAWVYILAALTSPLFAWRVDLWPAGASAQVWWSLGYDSLLAHRVYKVECDDWRSPW